MEDTNINPENQNLEGSRNPKRRRQSAKSQARSAVNSQQEKQQFPDLTAFSGFAQGMQLPLDQLLGEQALLALIQAGANSRNLATSDLINPSALGLIASLFSQGMPNIVTGASGSPSISTGNHGILAEGEQEQIRAKRKRSLRATPDPDAEVVALSPTSLMATNKFICDICGKEFQRDQNLQLHRRGHNVPWKLKQRPVEELPQRKRVYICPEPTCVHHDPSKALGDLGGIKKHYFRKHGEKKFKCENCSKRYAVEVDWKAHMKTCKRKEHQCDCKLRFASSYPSAHWNGHDHGHHHPCGSFFTGTGGQSQPLDHQH